MSAEQQDPEHTPTIKDRGSKKGSLLPILIGVSAVVVIVAIVAFVLQGRRAAAEQQATQQLKDMGAFPHTNAGHTDSLCKPREYSNRNKAKDKHGWQRVNPRKSGTLGGLSL